MEIKGRTGGVKVKIRWWMKVTVQGQLKTTTKKMLFFSGDAFELLFEKVKPLPDVVKVLATRENKLS